MIPGRHRLRVNHAASSVYVHDLNDHELLLLACIYHGCVDKIDWFASAAGGIIGSLVVEKMRSREEQALLGVGVGLTQGTVYLLTNLILRATSEILWY